MPYTYAGVEYKHLVQNRTDLTAPNSTVIDPNTGFVVAEGLVSYQLAGAAYGHGIIFEQFPTTDSQGNVTYKGEVIPPFAAMRIINNPTVYEDGRIVWPVARPDDGSMNDQQAALHFFNGPSAIQLKGYAEATTELPAPVLCDLTAQSNQLPYGNTQGVVPGDIASTGSGIIGAMLGFVSGSWALHPAGDIITCSPNFINLGNVTVPDGSVSMLAAYIPYAVVGQHPYVDLSDPTNNPSGLRYSGQVLWVGPGALSFGSVSGQGG